MSTDFAVAFAMGVGTIGPGLGIGILVGKGLEAIGRNPLAGRMIQVGMIINVLITALIMAAGLGVAYFVIIL